MFAFRTKRKDGVLRIYFSRLYVTLSLTRDIKVDLLRPKSFLSHSNFSYLDQMLVKRLISSPKYEKC